MISPKPGRRKNIAAAQRLAAKLSTEGIAVVASLVSPYRQQREEFKERRVGVRHFVEGYEPPLQKFVDIDTTGMSVEDCIQKILATFPNTTK